MTTARIHAPLLSPSTDAPTRKVLATESSSADDIASAGHSSPAASVSGGSVNSSFAPIAHQASSVSESPSGPESLAGSVRADVGPGAQRSQRLLVRVPSTKAVVVIPASALVFGRHKQRGKPLVLCAGFDGVPDAATAVCPDPENCRHVHADLTLATPFHPHRRSAAMLGQYPRMPAGTVEPVLSPDGETVDRIPSERMLLTRALDSVRRPIPQCEHFLRAVCNRGSECEFAHVVGATAAAPKVVAKTSVAITASKPQQKRKLEQQRQNVADAPACQQRNNQCEHFPVAQRQQPPLCLPPQASYPHRYDRGPQPQPSCYPQTSPYSTELRQGFHGGHAMPCWSMPCPSAASVLSSTWNA